MKLKDMFEIVLERFTSLLVVNTFIILFIIEFTSIPYNKKLKIIILSLVFIFLVSLISSIIYPKKFIK